MKGKETPERVPLWAAVTDPSPLEGRSRLLCSLEFPDKDSLDQTLVRLPGASLPLSPHLGPGPVSGLPLLSFTKNPAKSV